MNSELSQPSDISFRKAVIHVSDLPSLELYIDQVITLIDQGYATNKRTTEEKPLTKMMINNYSKAGLVRPIKGKKYAKEHIVQMLIIYALKGTLSIGEIKDVLDGLYAQPGFESAALFESYENALDKQGGCLASLEELLSSSKLLDAPDVPDRFASLMAVCAMSEALSQLAERMVTQYFSSPEKIKPETPKNKKGPHKIKPNQ
ncbi:DUF1836 domain-containing protein [Oscillospiraceae bacterium LTW-04]|nr:DUF1836 domain-containing protein [Oscillospiraceae bacterium MB24-C1]